MTGVQTCALPILPGNITLMPLPPKCPELNPVENVWQFMRDIRCQTGAAVRVLRSKDFLITRDRIVSGPCALKGVTQS